MLYPDISSVLFHSITLGLEMLVLNFSLSAKEKASVISSASNRYYLFLYISPDLRISITDLSRVTKANHWLDCHCYYPVCIQVRFNVNYAIHL